MDNTKHTILVVDDIPDNINILNNLLENDYNVKVANNGEKALKIAFSYFPPDLIMLDIEMPDMDGYEVCVQLKDNIKTRSIPVIFVTSKSDVVDENKGFKVGAVDYITKPISPPIVLARVKTHLALYDQNRELETKVKDRTRELNETRLEIIRELGRAAEYKDNETGMHVMRMSHYSQQVISALGSSEEEAELLLNAAPMHDLGKIGIPDSILTKPDKLDDEEWKIMKRHSKIGFDIINGEMSELLHAAKICAISHHEKWNGKGYPKGISGEEIPLYGRIVAITDVFDALTSKRPYKEAWPVDKAIDLIKKESGEHFQPEVVDAFMECLPEIIKIKEKFLD